MRLLANIGEALAVDEEGKVTITNKEQMDRELCDAARAAINKSRNNEESERGGAGRKKTRGCGLLWLLLWRLR